MDKSYFSVSTYDLNECAAFRKTKELHGGLSNMASGYPIKVQIMGKASGVRTLDILSTEALYQACRFPDHPEIQKEILEHRSPMAAKMVSKREKTKSREDFDDIKVDIMRWCLNLKLMQNYAFRAVLVNTGRAPIVEVSSRDSFWGAIPAKDGSHGFDKAIGFNVLGKLLMDLRTAVMGGVSIRTDPPSIVNLRLLGDDII